MAYLGRQLTSGNYLKLDDISSQFNGSTTTFNLTSGGNAFYPGSAYSIQVSLGGVVQEPESAYQVNQNQIIFATAPQSTDTFFCVVLGVALGIGVPGDSTVTGTKLSKPLNYNNGHVYFDSTTNRVGINSSSPRVTLDVVGVISATSFSGSGSGLTGISTNFVASVGIQSGGTTIGIGITQLNFVGTGNTFAVDGNTVSISIRSGAGGTFSANAVGVHTTKILGINTTTITGTANSEGSIQTVGNIALVDGAVLTDQNIDSNIFVPTGKNGLLIGPVTVAVGVTVDVASGSVLVVV